MPLSDQDRNEIVTRYSQRFAQHGYSPKTLGWDKGKQDVRFHILLSAFALRGKSVLDIGCGFGDMVPVLSKATDGDFVYHGIDLVGNLVEVAVSTRESKNVTFEVADFLSDTVQGPYDIVIASGIFNHKLTDMDNAEFVKRCLEKAFRLCTEGVAFDFLSDKTDYQYDHTYHSSPEEVLAAAYSLSRNVILRNDYMPFEFSVFVFKDDSFDVEDTMFRRYKDGRAHLEG